MSVGSCVALLVGVREQAGIGELERLVRLEGLDHDRVGAVGPDGPDLDLAAALAGATAVVIVIATARGHPQRGDQHGNGDKQLHELRQGPPSCQVCGESTPLPVIPLLASVHAALARSMGDAGLTAKPRTPALVTGPPVWSCALTANRDMVQPAELRAALGRSLADLQRRARTAAGSTRASSRTPRCAATRTTSTRWTTSSGTTSSGSRRSGSTTRSRPSRGALAADAILPEDF